MTDFEHALIGALNQCRRDGVKPVARNVKTRLNGSFAFYAEITIAVRLKDMLSRGLVKKASEKHPRSGYIPSGYHICPLCHQPVLDTPILSLAS